MTTILSTILQATAVSLFAGGVFWLVLRRFRGVSPNVHRLIWFGVLLLGVCIVRCPVNIPVTVAVDEPEPAIPMSSVMPIVAQNELRRDLNPVPLDYPDTVQQETKTERWQPGTECSVVTGSGIRQSDTEKSGRFISLRSRLPISDSLLSLISPVILTVWLAGVIVLLVRRGVLFVRLELRLRSLQQNTANNDAARDWNKLLTQFGIAPERVPVLWSDSEGPALVRTVRGYRLLFPQSLWDELSPTHREGVLRHELSHYLSGDVWTSELARLLATLQWFNPVAWIALRKLEEATEWRCDDFAVAAGAINGSHSERGLQVLIETLLAVHESTESLGLYLSSFARINVITRIKRLQHHHHFRKENTLMKKTLLLTLFLAFMLAAMLQVRLTATPQGETKEPPTSQETQTSIEPPVESKKIEDADELVSATKQKQQKTIRGKVILGDDMNAVVPGAIVASRARGLSDVDQIANQNGSFEIQPQKAPVYVEVMSPDMKFGKMMIVAPDESEFVVSLEPTASVRGKIIDCRSDKPPVGCKVSYAIHIPAEFGTAFMSQFQRETTTNDEGEYVFHNIPTGVVCEVILPTYYYGENYGVGTWIGRSLNLQPGEERKLEDFTHSLRSRGASEYSFQWYNNYISLRYSEEFPNPFERRFEILLERAKRDDKGIFAILVRDRDEEVENQMSLLKIYEMLFEDDEVFVQTERYYMMCVLMQKDDEMNQPPVITSAMAEEFVKSHKIDTPLPSLFSFAFFDADGKLHGVEPFDHTAPPEKQKADLIKMMAKY